MAVGVVDSLEVIDIQLQQHSAEPGVQDFFYLAFPGNMVKKSGHAVCFGKRL